MNVSNFKSIMTNVIGRSGLILKKYAPEILLGAGIVGGVTATVLACKASTKAGLLARQSKEILATVYEAKLKYPPTTYSENDFRRDLALAYTQSAVGFVKLYGPSVTLGIMSIGLILASHGMMSKRNAALIAAYKLVDESFSKYRKRVAEEIGVEKEKQFRYNLVAENDSEKVDEAGKESKKTELEGFELSEYGRWFDESSPQFKKDNSMNLFFLQAQQTFANHLLQARGHVFLNEIYDALSLPRSRAGAIVGWVKNHGDNYVDFNMYSPSNDNNRDYVNGYNVRRVLLDFNVDGVIYDMI